MATAKQPQAVEEQIVPQAVEEQIDEQVEQILDEANAPKNFKSIVRSIIANGANKCTNVVKNVNITEKDNYTMVSFTLQNRVKGFVSNDGGITYESGLTNVIYTSLYAIVGTMKEDENLSWMANFVMSNPSILNLVLNGSKITFLQQEIAMGEEYINPFSTQQDPEPNYFDHDVIINHVIGFELGNMGKKMADKLADKIMENMF